MGTTEENNRLIAEFMGFKLNEKIGTPVFYNDKTCEVLDIYYLLYNSSWDWLMEVVERIESLENGRFEVNILKSGTQIFEYQAGGKVIVDNVADISFSMKIEHTYPAIIEFIEWYNENK